MTRPAWLVAVVAVAGCGRVGFEPLGTGTDGGSGTRDGAAAGDASAGDASTTDGSTACTCPIAEMFVGTGGSNSQGFPAGGDQGYAGSCGGGGAPEVVLGLTVMDTGTYRFRMAQAGPTVFYVRDGCCEGAELRCTTSPLTPFTLSLTAGQHVVMFSDGMNLGQSAIFEVTGL